MMAQENISNEYLVFYTNKTTTIVWYEGGKFYYREEKK